MHPADEAVPATTLPATPSAPWPGHLVGQSERPVRVLLVDDDAHLRRVVAGELLADHRIELVGQAQSLREARLMASRHAFDVLLVDLNLGDGSGFSLIEQVRHKNPMVEVVVISALADDQHALHAFELGAMGYLIKHDCFGNFAQAVLQVVNGGAAITPALARRLIQRLDARPAGVSGQLAACESLSDREREVLKMVAAGYTNPEIGERLAISGLTVNAHIRNINRKLQVRSRAQAVSRAMERGLL